MGQVRNIETGKVLTLYDEDELAALKTGRYETVDDRAVPVSLAGATVAASPSELVPGGVLPDVLPANQLELDAQSEAAYQESLYNSPEHASEAFGRGVLSAQTLGLTDLGLNLAGADRGSELYNPGWRTGGEIAGALSTIGVGAETAGAATLLPGAKASQLAARLGETAGGVTGLAIQGAVEGAAYGAAQKMGQLTITDPEFSAEAMVSSVLEGGLEGGLVGGVVGGGLGLLGKAAERFSGTRRAGDGLVDLKAPRGAKDLELAYEVEKTASKTAGDARSVAPAALETAKDVAARNFDTVSGSLSSLEETALNVAKRGLDPDVAVLNPGQGMKIHKLAKEVDEAGAEFMSVWGVKAGDGGAIEALPKNAFEKFLQDTPEMALQKSTALENYMDKLARLTELSDVETELVGARNAMTSIREALTPTKGVDVNDIVSAIGSKAEPGAAGEDIFKQYLMGKGTDGLPFKYEGPVTVNQAQTTNFNKTRQLNPATLMTMVSQGMSSPRGALQLINYVSQRTGGLIAGIGGVLKGAVIGAARNAPKARPAIRPLAQIMSKVSFDGEKKTAPKNQREALKQRSEELNRIMANPMAYQKELNQQLSHIRAVNFQLADELEMKLMGTVKYLHSILPKDPGSAVVLGKSRWQPDDMQVTETSRYFSGALDTVGTFNRAIEGKITPQEAKALRVTNPRTFQKIQMAVMESLPELQQNLSYDQQIGLGILLDMPTNPSLNKENVKFIQASYEAAAEGPGNQPIDLKSNNMQPEPMSEAQKLQGR